MVGFQGGVQREEDSWADDRPSSSVAPPSLSVTKEEQRGRDRWGMEILRQGPWKAKRRQTRLLGACPSLSLLPLCAALPSHQPSPSWKAVTALSTTPTP